jgi:cytidyltransferase-like protein
MVGLFFGSFNPIHIGHLMLANYMISFENLSEVWFVVSPHNPLKDKKSLLNEKQRLYMTNLAIEDFPKFKEIQNLPTSIEKVDFLEKSIKQDIEEVQKRKFDNFVPYIQLHEFEALVFTSVECIYNNFESNKINKSVSDLFVKSISVSFSLKLFVDNNTSSITDIL